MMKIQHICIGTASRIPGKASKTGIFKHPVKGPVIIDAEGLAGDAIINRKHHGGVDQAVYLEGSLTLDWWANELGEAYLPGTFGENLVIADLDNRAVCAGDRFQAGDVLLEATKPRTPCSIFALRMADPAFPRRYRASGRPGIYCRVLKGGLLAAGEDVIHIPSRGTRLPISDMMRNPRA